MRIEEQIGQRLRAERERRGMPLIAVGQQVAAFTGREWSPQTVWQFETGKRQMRVSEMVALALVLDLPLAHLLLPSQDGEEVELYPDVHLSRAAAGVLFALPANAEGESAEHLIELLGAVELAETVRNSVAAALDHQRLELANAAGAARALLVAGREEQS